MNTFENSMPAQESPKTPEELKGRLSELQAEQAELQKLIAESGENIGAELGSEAYKDFGYTARLDEVVAEITKIEAQLTDIDDQAAAQRNLAL